MGTLGQVLEEYSRILNEGLVPILHCLSCGAKVTMPRAHCPRCLSRNLRVAGVGGGKVISYTIIERGLPERAVVVLVDLGGALAKGNYVGDPAKLRVGLSVRPRVEGNALFFESLDNG